MKNAWNTLTQWIQRHLHNLLMLVEWPFWNQPLIIQGILSNTWICLFALSLHSNCFLCVNCSCLLFFLLARSQLFQGNPGSVSAALQQIQAQTQQTTVTTWPIYYSLFFFPFWFSYILFCCLSWCTWYILMLPENSTDISGKWREIWVGCECIKNLCMFVLFVRL